jgi:VWFA-related protein
MSRRCFAVMAGILICLGGLGLPSLAAPGAAKEKKPPAQQEAVAPGVIQAESNLVLVNVIVTDKQGHYLRDIKREEFHVFEDGKEQPITSFSHEAGNQPGTAGEPGAITPVAAHRTEYALLFFDNASMNPDGQLYERDQAARFVEMAASPDRKMAVINFDGFPHLDQNFTSDRDLLLKAVKQIKLAPTRMDSENHGDRRTTERWRQQESALDVQYLLQALRDVARTLGTAPGRKTLIFLSAGIPVTPEAQRDFQYTVDALNKANVGVYAIDALGLEGPSLASASVGHTSRLPTGSIENPPPPGLYPLASQTGGFAYINKNDLQAAMERAFQDMKEYYILAYNQPNPVHDGRYHKIRAKVDRPGVEIRMREGYFDTKKRDFLAGKPTGSALEAQATSSAAGEIPVALSAPYFYERPGVARVNLSLSVPGSAVTFKRHGDVLNSQLNVLGIATRADGWVAARFSDTVDLSYPKDQKREVASTPVEYRNTFKIVPGEYMLRVVLTAGSEEFGKYVTPLNIDPFAGKQLTLSGPAFGERVEPCPTDSAEADLASIEGSVPLVVNGMQLIPASSNRFKQSRHAMVYVEAYDPLLAQEKMGLVISFSLFDRAGARIYSSPPIPIDRNIHPGRSLVPAIFALPMDNPPPGDYRIEIQARDSAGSISPVCVGFFSVE